MDLREELITLALKWQDQYGVAPSITSALSELDASKLVGMPNSDYSYYMQDRTAVSRGHDFIFNNIRYQIKAHRPSGKTGSKVTNAGKASNYDWDILIWILYDTKYNIVEAWQWEREKYRERFHAKKGVTPNDMRNGHKIR